VANTQQQTAVNYSQSILQLLGQLQSVRNQVAAMVITYTDLSPTTVWSNLATFAWNADGSAGTADGAPNTAHPISVSGLNRSEAQLAAGVQLLSDFQTFASGGALAATGSRNATIDQLVG
jgi:hypothetical protein